MKKNLLGISTLTLVGLYALLSVVVLGVCLIVDFPITYGIIFSIVVLILQFLLAPFFTDLSVKWFYKTNFNAEIPEYLKDFLNEICQKEKIKVPKIGVINDSAPNAFTYGRFKNDARLVVTKGIFELLTEDEVKAVVGHEMGHVVHLDMLFMTVAQLVPLVLYFLFQTFSENDSSDDSNSGVIIAIVAYVLYIISQYIILWLSRTREYYADEYSIETTKNPNALSSALVKIGFGLSIGRQNEVVEEENGDKKKKKQKVHSAKDIGALGIFDSKTSKSLIVSTNNNINDKVTIKNAMKWEMWNPWAFIYELNSTHPLISKRLLAISNYSTSYNQEPFIVFDLKQEESYVDDFFVELVIKYSPLLVVILTIILVLLNIDGNVMSIVGFGGMITVALSYIGFNRSHKIGYKEANIRDLLGEVKVSGVTSVPCILEGKIIGKGDPGCIFNEDFTLQDETGIIFLDYNQPMFILNKIFAIFKSHQYVDQKVKIKGWYRRSPVPYVEIYEMEVDGKVKKIFTYGISIAFHIIFAFIFIFLLLGGLV